MTLLRCVGVMESSLKQELADLNATPEQRITFDSFAGQTNIRLWAKAGSQATLDEKLMRLKRPFPNASAIMSLVKKWIAWKPSFCKNSSKIICI